MSWMLLLIAVLIPVVGSGALLALAARVSGAPRCSLLPAIGIVAVLGILGAALVLAAGAFAGGPGAVFVASILALALGWIPIGILARVEIGALLRLWATYLALSVVVWPPVLLGASWILGRWIG